MLWDWGQAGGGPVGVAPSLQTPHTPGHDSLAAARVQASRAAHPYRSALSGSLGGQTVARHKTLVLNHRVSFQTLMDEGSDQGAKQEGNSEGQRKTILGAESAKNRIFVLLRRPELQVLFEEYLIKGVF